MFILVFLCQVPTPEINYILFIGRNQNALVRNYRHGFSGFAARLTKEEANSIAHRPGVISVFRDPILKLHTTRSWGFLKDQSPLPKTHGPNRTSNSAPSSDVVIGILDSGSLSKP